ncbi:MAG: recombinase family protein [Lachnospiraceae bacterium]|nr:recombinase family protein [Lachnospiraceae bacterium]
MIYGYCRVSTARQDITRQVRNIKELYPQADIRQEVFTGKKTTGRREYEKLLRTVKSGDTIVFDSVSRMSRNADEGFEIYQNLMDEGVELVFLNEPYINTDVYRKALQSAAVPMTGTSVDLILEGVNKYLMELAKEQIRIAFEQSEKEVTDLSIRTKQGLVTARMKGKTLGRPKGVKPITSKSVEMKRQIKRLSKAFGGSNTDAEIMSITGLARNTYYKYKKELLEEAAE